VAEAAVIRYDGPIEEALSRISSLLKGDYPVSARFIALLLLQGDPEIEAMVREKEGDAFASIREEVGRAAEAYAQPLSLVISFRLHQETRRLLSSVLRFGEGHTAAAASAVDRLTLHPLSGTVLLLGVLGLLYLFVGIFGAGVLVDLIEGFFESSINPLAHSLMSSLIPIGIIAELFVGDYGIITLGLRYAIAIILPIVGTFFIAFSLIEDSGYLPRLALLVDRAFKVLGLSGRAVIPMVLGFGCDTMATVVTRTLETPRERVIATLLLALAIPCSAQLGVIFAILAGSPRALLIWAAVVGMVLLLVGILSSRLLPGGRPSFYMELPPLRFPRLVNILEKTYARMHWYFMEVLPIFILASFLIWLGKLTGAFDFAVRAMQPLLDFAGLPSETAVAFIFGFFRRDYGAAVLFDLARQGVLSGTSLLVAAVTLTLFVPCIAQFAVMVKERGWRTALAIGAFIFPFAFSVGALLNLILRHLGVTI